MIRPTKNIFSDPLAAIQAIDKIECGKDAARHFGFGKDYINLNHGSFGTYPNEIKAVLRHFQDQCEERPDVFIRFEGPRRSDESREVIAKYLNAPVEGIVLVPNATTGVNTVLRNLVYQPNDVIIYFSTIYGACQKTIEYICETTPAESAAIEYVYPISDADLINKFKSTITSLRKSGKNPRLAFFDTIVSMPGVRMPFEQLTQICRTEKILSLVDGAHSIGHIPIDLKALDPDFYITNCHKWLHVPRGCAVFYVPERNQPLMRSTLPTSHGFVPKTGEPGLSPLPPTSGKSAFVAQFEFVGTVDSSPYFCVPAALAWRKKVRYGELRGEEAVQAYVRDVAREGGEVVAKWLGTAVMENREGTLRRCGFANVELPLGFQEDAGGDFGIGMKIGFWMGRVMIEEYNTFLAVVLHDEKFWVRLSGQIYLTIEDFEWCGMILKKLCERAKKGEWKDESRAKLS